MVRYCVAAVMVAAAVAGCDSAPETPPMDQPIDRDAAMDVDSRMRKSTDELLREHEAPPQ